MNDYKELIAELNGACCFKELPREAKPKCGTCDYNGGIVLTCDPPLYPCGHENN